MRTAAFLLALILSMNFLLAACPCASGKGGTVTIMNDSSASSDSGGQGQGNSASNESPKMLPAWDDSKCTGAGGRENCTGSCGNGNCAAAAGVSCQGSRCNGTQEQGRNQTQERNQTGGQEGGGAYAVPEAVVAIPNGNGISSQVHAIIAQRKNGTITVPQGMLVRIEAQNRVINVGNETELSINETLRANVMVHGKNRTLVITPVAANMVNITDDGVTVSTGETLELSNGTLTIGNESVNVLPSGLAGALKAKRIRSAVVSAGPNHPVYTVAATRNAKFLWLFDSDMDVDAVVDANTGQVISETRPWWAFLASTD